MKMKKSAQGFFAVMLSVIMLMMSAAVPAFAEDLIVPEEALAVDPDFLPEEEYTEDPAGTFFEGEALEIVEVPDGDLTEEAEEELFLEDDASTELTEEADSGEDILEAGEGNEDLEDDAGNDAEEYKITIASADHGTVISNKEKAAPGEVVELTVTPEEGYGVYKVTATSPEGVSFEVTQKTVDDRYKFNMPAYDVAVSAVFAPDDVYEISVESKGSGTVEVVSEKTSAMMNETVYFTATPEEGYEIRTIDVGGAEEFTGPDAAGTCSFRMPPDNVTIFVEFAPISAVYNAYTASFDGEIRLNFYIEVPDSIKDGIFARIYRENDPSDISEIKVTDTTHYDDGLKKGYKFSFGIRPREVDEDIVVMMCRDKGDGSFEPISFTNSDRSKDFTKDGLKTTLLDYLEYMITQSDSETMRNLAAAAKDYCYAAKQHFDNINCEDKIRMDKVNAVSGDDLSPYAFASTGTLPDGVEIEYTTVMFLSDNSYRLYLKFDETKVNPDELTFQVDGKKAALRSRDVDESKKYLTFINVAAPKLQENHTFTIAKDGTSYTATVSVLTYARAVINGTDSRPSMVTLAKALYLYNQAAIAHFNR